jgi:glycosyltransferase involved in cell wall biosynthesis
LTAAWPGSEIQQSDVSDTPILTVGIPVYNGAQHIAAAISSVQAQNWAGRLEILIVDDGSTDETQSVLASLRASDSRIRIITHDANYGRPFARNTILREARGRYLAWLDVDDEWFPLKLPTQFDTLYENTFDGEGEVIVMCPFDWKWKGSLRHRTVVPASTADTLKAFLSGQLGAYLWSMLAPTKTFRAVGYFDESLPRLQDLDFLIRFARSGGKIVVAGTKPLCVYNKDDSERTGRVVAGSLAHIWAKHKPLYLQYGSIFALSCRAKHHSLAARHAYSNEGVLLGGYYSARAFAAKAIRLGVVLVTPAALSRRMQRFTNSVRKNRRLK